MAVYTCYVARAPSANEIRITTAGQELYRALYSIKLPRVYLSIAITNTSRTYDVWSHASKMKMYSSNNMKLHLVHCNVSLARQDKGICALRCEPRARLNNLAWKSNWPSINHWDKN